MSKKTIFSLLVIITIIACDKANQKQSTNNKVSDIKRLKETELSTDSILEKDIQNPNNSKLDCTPEQNKGLSFDNLMNKFYLREINNFDFRGIFYSDYYDNDNLYCLTSQDIKTLQLCELFEYTNEKIIKDSSSAMPSKYIAYSHHTFFDEVYGITILRLSDGGFNLYFATYRDDKLISYSKEPFAESFGDIGFDVYCKTQKITDTTFYTIAKEQYNKVMLDHSEIMTRVTRTGQIVQNKNIIQKRDFQDVLDSLGNLYEN